MHGEKIIEFLNDEFHRRKAMRPNYSYRAFADLLQMDASTLLQILKSKRKLSFEKASEILKLLEVPLDKKNALLLSLDDPRQYSKPHSSARVLTAEEFSHMKDWEGFACIDSLLIDNLQKTPAGIAKKIGSTPEKVREILDYCSEIGLVRKIEDRYESLGVNYSTAIGLDSNIQESHRQWLQKGMDRIWDEGTDFDITGSTMAGSRAKIDECKRRIRDFRLSLMSYLEDDEGEKDEVFRLSIQFFAIREGKKPAE